MDIKLLIRSFAVIVLITLGYLFKKKGHFSQDTIESINKLVFKLVLPAFLFIAFLNVNFEVKLIYLPLTGLILASLMLALGYLSAWLFRIKDTYYKFAMTTFEGGMIAYPIFSMIFGADKIFMIALIDLGNAVLFFTVIMLMLAKHNDKSITSALKDSMPILLAMFLGIIFNSLNIHTYLTGSLLYDIAIEAMTLLSVPMLTLIAISIGIDLEFNFKTFFEPFKLIAIRYVFAVLFSLGLYYFLLAKLGYEIIYLHALLIFSLAPSSLLLPALVPKEERKIMSSIISIFVPFSIIVLVIYGMIAV